MPVVSSKKSLCEFAKKNGGVHPRGVRAHPERGMKGVGDDVQGGKKKLWERYRQPGPLWETVFRFLKDKTLDFHTVGNRYFDDSHFGLLATSVFFTVISDCLQLQSFSQS